MKLYFSPAYTGNVFLQTPDGSVWMDVITLNAVGLVNWLELRLGLHVDEIPQSQRVALYYDALCDYMDHNPQNILVDSFRLSGLSTAKAILEWRDELCMAGWNFKGAEISDRLKVIIGTEEFFRKSDNMDLATRFREVNELIKTQKVDFKGIEVYLPCELESMKPLYKNLLKTLEDAGAQIHVQLLAPLTDSNLSKVRQLLLTKEQRKITLDENDKSFQIYHFPTDWEAYRYLAHRGMEGIDLWINPDNKQMDNWLTLMNKPKTGSVMKNCTPQLTQLFVMGLGLFAEPLNVNTLVEWLNMPLHPLERFFRTVLADAIVKEGGFRNEKCAEIIRKYIDGDYVYLDEEMLALPADKQDAFRAKGKRQRIKNVKVFLPSMDKKADLLTEDVRAFASELQGWAKKKVFLLTQLHQDELWSEQLNAVVSMLESFLILMNTVNTKKINYQTIDSWMSSIYVMDDYTNTVAEKGSRIVIDSPAKMISVANRTVWVGLEDMNTPSLEGAFLYPTEKEALIADGLMNHWNEEDENLYHESLRLLPIRKTSQQLILVTFDRKGGEECTSSPLLVRLHEEVANLKAFITTPTFMEEELEEVDAIDNGGVDAELKFEFADKIKWPDHLSPTAIETLTAYPLDYLLENLLNVTSAGKAQMADLKITKGIVAHAVIASLFAPREGQTCATADEIEVRMRQTYQTVYKEVVEAHGAILQLPENKLTEKLLNEQLTGCLDSLLEILKENRLKVIGCERLVEDYMNFGLPERDKDLPARDLLGFIDMTLEDEQGHLVVFDFKWTSSKSYYQDLLTENRSTQLAFYRSMLGHEQHKLVSKVGYFLMPEGTLYSQEKFEGKNCQLLEPKNTDDIIPQLKQSVLYRKNQLENGIVETNGAFHALQYVVDTPTKQLFPLVEDEKEGTKKENIFSKFGLFNA